MPPVELQVFVLDGAVEGFEQLFARVAHVPVEVPYQRLFDGGIASGSRTVEVDNELFALESGKVNLRVELTGLFGGEGKDYGVGDVLDKEGARYAEGCPFDMFDRGAHIVDAVLAVEGSRYGALLPWR